VDNVDKLDLIKKTLEKRGVTQTKLAELLGVNLTTVNNWFRRGNIPEKYLYNISVLFNLNISTNHTPMEPIKPKISTIEPTSSPTTVKYKKIKHINSDIKNEFCIDNSVIGDKDLDNIRFNTTTTAIKVVDIVDISVDTYCGDGIYYLKYPHGFLAKRIIYNFNTNTYTIIDMIDNSLKIEVMNFNGKLSGKVIARMEVF
jgi:transcriptional regulator with XRE-family HTH domain